MTWDPITLFECDVCEWAATTGAPWKRCPNCDTVVPPSARQYVRLSEARHAVRAAPKLTPEAVASGRSAERPGARPTEENRGRQAANLTGIDALLYGGEGEEWPLWMGHLPWDVRDSYSRILTAARRQYRFLHDELDRERAKLCEMQGQLDEAEWNAPTAPANESPFRVPLGCTCHGASGSFGCEAHGNA